MHACRDGASPAVVSLLLDAGADPAAATPVGDTALSLAKEAERDDLIELLQ